MATRAFVGLDVGSADAHVCFLLADGSEPVPRWSVPNSLPGAESLAQTVAQLAQQHSITELRVGMEATGLLWWHLAQFLRTTSVLEPYAPQVYALNPHLITTFRATFGALPKTDRIDAFLIAERIRFGRHLPAPYQLDARYAPLQRLTRFRLHLVQNLAREKNYCLSFLFLSFSGFGQASPFGDPFGATSSAVLEEFTIEELAQQPLDELTTYIQTKGRNRFADPEAVATTLQRAARDSYRLDQVLQEPLRFVLATTLASIRSLQAQLKTLDTTITRELAGLPQTLESVPGLGPVWTAGLVAELGAISRFEDDAAIAQYAGLTWSAYQSASYQSEDTAMTKRGNAYLRYYIIEAANSVRLHCPEYKAYYAAKVAETPRHAHKRALVLTARKLVRLIHALLRTGTPYQRPAERQNRPARSLMEPQTVRPEPPRRYKRASAVE